jgi:hypothetical protein
MESFGRETKRASKQKGLKVREILELVKERMEEEMPGGRGFVVVTYKRKKARKGKKVRLKIASNVGRLEQFRMANDFLVVAEERLNGEL